MRIIPLGGLGEIGKNMMALEWGDDIIVIDCGVQFPSEDMPGVDLVIPDTSYLRDNVERVRAILITHGHEDHIGALPFVLPDLDVPVYAPRLAHGLISVKLKERRASRGLQDQAHAIEPGVRYDFGENFHVTWFRVCHSIPDAMGMAIETPLGMVIHTGDFKIDHTPADGKPMDLAALAGYGANGVLLLCSDSTYAEVEGFTPSEQVLESALDRAIGDAAGRVLVATFASLISRVQQVIQAAANHQRKVCIVGRSMVDNVHMAEEMGYLDIPPGVLVSINQSRGIPPEEIVFVTTGSQGEPTSALVRIANQEHRDVKIIAGDTVIISAPPIPGNELLVSRTIDNLLRQGAKVLYDKIALVHVHGHASREELKMMISLIRPKYFVPVHGEYRHLVAHARLAGDLGVAEEGIFVLEDGDVLEITEEGGQVVDTVSAGPIFIDGLTTHDTQSQVLRDRRFLSRDGMVAVVVTIDRGQGHILDEPKILASGFMAPAETSELFQKLSAHLEQMLATEPLPAGDPEQLKAKIREIARKFLFSESHRRPIIMSIVLER